MIKSTWKRALAATAAAAALNIVLTPSVDAQNRRRSGADPAPKKERVSLSIVQVGEELRILPGREVPALRKELAERYNADLKEWKKEKTDAKKAKVPFTEEKPKAPAVKVLKTGISSQETAEKLAKEMTEKMATKARAATRYVIVDQAGALSVLTTTQAEDTKKSLAESYKAALREYAETKKAAAKEGSPFDLPKPPKPSFRIVSSRFKSEAEALAALEKEKEKQSKRNDTE